MSTSLDNKSRTPHAATHLRLSTYAEDLERLVALLREAWNCQFQPQSLKSRVLTQARSLYSKAELASVGGLQPGGNPNMWSLLADFKLQTLSAG